MSDTTDDRLRKLEQLCIRMGHRIQGQTEEIDRLRGQVESLTEELQDAKSMAAVAITASIPGRADEPR